MNALPIDAYLTSILSLLAKSSSLIVEAAPGAGKTTRIPPALIDSPVSKNQQVWVLEPRRLAARLSANRIAQERKEKLGETVGYQVRYENFSSERTRLLFLTEGLFTRKLIHNPTKGLATVKYSVSISFCLLHGRQMFFGAKTVENKCQTGETI